MFIPSKVRTALYIIGVVGTPIVAVLASNNLVSTLVVQLWAAYVTGVSALAAAHVTPDETL